MKLPWILFGGRLCVYEYGARIRITRKMILKINW